MKFKVFVKRRGKLFTLWDIQRTPTGLYFHDRTNPKSYMTYHEDGAYWDRSGRARIVKKRRPPLADLKGTYTLSTATFNILAPLPTDRVAEGVQLRSNDIVVEYPGIFGAEVILSDQVQQLEPMSSRVNSKVFPVQYMPIIMFEFFDNPTNTMPAARFPSPPVMAMIFDGRGRI